MENEKEILFRGARLIGAPEKIESGWLRVRGQHIHSMGAGELPSFKDFASIEIIDCDGQIVMPGFIDLHTHGALGSDFVFGNPDEIKAISHFYATHGVTSFLATTYAASQAELLAAIAAISNCMGREPGARILGIHLEGPWLNPTHSGAQAVDRIRVATPTETLPYLDSGLVRLVTLAPEIPENQWLITECVSRQITVSAGHSNATFENVFQAVGLGVTQVTHCFNGMRSLHHREPGLVGAALSLPDLSCELIADNIHVHPAVMKILLQSKTASGITLVTDSISATGMPDGIFELEGQPVYCRDGAARLADGTLAGSVLTMDQALRNFVQATGGTLDILWPSVNHNAARAIHLDHRKGLLTSGMDADLVILDSNLQVKLTMIEGKIVFNDR
jgi:N-acetylglucosamine-6-phosphate deacetylase